MTARIEHANLTVPDLDAAITFLQTLEPDFEVLHDSGPGEEYRWVHVGTPAGYIALEEPHEPGKPGTRARYADYGVNHVGFVVDDVDAVAERLLAAGYEEGFRAERHPSRIRRYFLDSNGFEWELVQYLVTAPEERFRYA
ncbi:VOC family protein [Oceanibium sediminis]|uniref:VOC family protein n=1 Tax=Oceanibium sediminis TaxID=2026339 RepID=UPI000DD489DF|nr:VOC family protein [Oceanibium sediminis]